MRDVTDRDALYELGAAPQRDIVPREEDEPCAREEHNLRTPRCIDQHRTSLENTKTHRREDDRMRPPIREDIAPKQPPGNRGTQQAADAHEEKHDARSHPNFMNTS